MCDNPKCQTKDVKDLKACMGCFQNVYCSKQCQKEHWAIHKPNCKIRHMNLEDVWGVLLNHNQTPPKIHVRLNAWKDCLLWKNLMNTLKQMAFSYKKKHVWSCTTCKSKLNDDEEHGLLWETSFDSDTKIISLFFFCEKSCQVKYAGHFCSHSRTCPYQPNFIVNQIEDSLQFWIYHPEHCSPFFLLAKTENMFRIEFGNLDKGTSSSTLKDFLIKE